MKEGSFPGSSPAQEKAEACPTKAEAWREDCKSICTPFFVYLIFFIDLHPLRS